MMLAMLKAEIVTMRVWKWWAECLFRRSIGADNITFIQSYVGQSMQQGHVMLKARILVG